ncbi:MAG: pyridoxamine 5'-phosphate oxidase [Bacteroidales bacterium]|nr:pyridoxamine 5'-phosphate oxidase [Bacteroidales bacterium]
MKEIINFLTKNQNQCFASIGLDGKPKVRPFLFMFERDEKIFFCTSNKKEVYREIKQNQFIELCAMAKDMSWLRLQGKVVFSNELKDKEKVFEVSPLVKSIYKNPENPDFEVFYLDEIKAHVSSLNNKTI